MTLPRKPHVLALAASLAILSTAPAAAQSRSPEPPAAYRLGPVEVVGKDSDQLQLGIGAFNVIPNDTESDGVFHDDTAVEGRIEYRLGDKIHGIGPMIGLAANGEGGVYGYGALYSDLRVGHWYITPSAGLGGYHRGGGKELGGVFQFHLGLDAGWRMQDGSRIGLKMTHISNAYTQDENPGVESVLVTYTLPVGRF